jgi:hypothetical protein
VGTCVATAGHAPTSRPGCLPPHRDLGSRLAPGPRRGHGGLAARVVCRGPRRPSSRAPHVWSASGCTNSRTGGGVPVPIWMVGSGCPTRSSRWPTTSLSRLIWPRTAAGDGRSSKVGSLEAMSVSGEILLIDGPGGLASRLVDALRRLTSEVPVSEFALIGGLAVMTRLGRVHRATDDLDAAAPSIEDGPSRLSILVGRDSGRQRRTVEGVKVDCIDVGPTEAAKLNPADLPDNEFDRAFLLAHRWALDSAREAVLSALSEQRVPIATATCRVATAAALVAMKLQSAPRRRAERAHKGPNDYADLYLLLSQPESLNEVISDLPYAPHGLGQWCAERIQFEFVTEARRSARAVQRTTVADPPTPDDMERIGREAFLRLTSL